MRLYAMLMSVIALASIAANIGFGYYLNEFEQTNRKLQAQIINYQQQQASQKQHVYLLRTELTVSESLVRQLQRQLRDTSHAVARVLATTTPHATPWCSRQLRGSSTHTNVHQIGRQMQALYQRLYTATVDDVTYTDSAPNGIRVAVSVTTTHDQPAQTDVLTLTDRRDRQDALRITVATRCMYVIP